MGCAQSRTVPPEDQLAPRVSTAASNSPAHNPKVVVIGESEDGGVIVSRLIEESGSAGNGVGRVASAAMVWFAKLLAAGRRPDLRRGRRHAFRSTFTRYTTQRFNDASTTTIGSAFKRTSVQLPDGNTLGIDIWDTAGQERYRALAPMYLRDAAGALLVYDITSADSFQACQGWLEQLQKLNERRPCTAICLAGNKSDLVVASGQRQVAKQQAQQFAEQHGLGFEEVSALTGDGVDAAFLHIGQRLQQQRLLQLPEPRQA